MYFVYGSYQHAENEVAVSKTVKRSWSERQYLQFLEHSYSINGRLRAADASTLATNVAALEAAYATQNQSFALYYTGGTASHIAVDASATLDGVQVVTGPDFNTSQFGQLVLYRDFAIGLQCRFDAAESQILEFAERVTIQGDGSPFLGQVLTENGLQVQQTSDRSPVTAVQEGTALAWSAYPPVPAPLWGYPIFRPQESSTSYDSPRIMRTRATEYRVSWRYVFIADSQLFGLPNVG